MKLQRQAWNAVAIVLMLWLVAMLTSHTWGGWIHLLLLIAVGIAIVRATRRADVQ